MISKNSNSSIFTLLTLSGIIKIIQVLWNAQINRYNSVYTVQYNDKGET